jgi:two-component system, sporulation sensor kinase C
MNRATVRVENPLRASRQVEPNEVLVAVMESARVPLAYLDSDLYFVRVNRRYADALGRRPEELVGRRYAAFYPGEDEEALFERVRRTGKPVDLQRTASGMPVRLAPVMGERGRLAGFVISHQEVTLNEERLMSLRAVDRAILTATSEKEIVSAILPHVTRLLLCRRAGVLLIDEKKSECTVLGIQGADGRVQHEGTRLGIHPMWDLDRLKQGRMQFISDLDKLTPRSPFLDEIVTSGVRSVVHVPLLAAGELIGVLSLACNSVRDLEGEGAEMAHHMADQLAVGLRQARLQAEVKQRTEELEQRVAERTAALKASEARFRTIFEDAAVGIALVDEGNRVVASNPALQEMLGYTKEELRGKSFAEFTHPDDVPVAGELYQELLEGKLRHYYVEKRYLRKDGSLVWVRPTVSLIQGDGSPLYAVKMVEDVTEQKKAQEALIEAEKLTLAGRLGATMAHEINNPLQTVIGCLGLAEESLADYRDPSRYLRVAREELHRAARIVTQLRDLHRRSTVDDREPTDLNALLQNVRLLVSKEAENRRVEIILDLDDDIPPAMFAADKVRQALLNVTLNAIESMLDGGQLMLRTERTFAPDGIRVLVVDQGEGIPEQEMQNLFDPFYTTKPDGLGLGLYISRRIVLDHKGEMAITSDPDVGTTVKIWFPITAR